MAGNSFAPFKDQSSDTGLDGKNDQLIPCENSKILADQIPNSKLVELENSSHIYTTDQTEKSVEAILEFLEIETRQRSCNLYLIESDNCSNFPTIFDAALMKSNRLCQQFDFAEQLLKILILSKIFRPNCLL